MKIIFPRVVNYFECEHLKIGSLNELRSRYAYVLLGDPGMGKTELFQFEAGQVQGGVYLAIHDFLDLYESKTRDETEGQTLFIDGLDEIRASSALTVVSQVRKLLAKLGNPRFRLSCRSAEWQGQSDASAFQALLPKNESMLTATLQPISSDQIVQFLEQLGIDAQVFVRNAEKHSLTNLISNPQTLLMLVEAIDGDKWPSSRYDVFDLACRKIVAEHNCLHQKIKSYSIDLLLDAAGYWMAVMLLSNKRKLSNQVDKVDVISRVHTEDFDLENFPLVPVLKSRLFHSIADDLYDYSHRSVAEFLGARYIVNQIKSGLPANRILSLLCGNDGGVVAGLRGLYSWLSVHCLNDFLRKQIMSRDPVATILYGDVTFFSCDQKKELFDLMRVSSYEYSSFLWRDDNQVNYSSLGTLISVDMEDHVFDLIASLRPTEKDEPFSLCLLSAIEYAVPLGKLKQPLLDLLKDSNYSDSVRRFSLDALLVDESNFVTLVDVAKSIRDGVLTDPDDELLGRLLRQLYPIYINSTEIFGFWHPPKNRNLIGAYHMFWENDLLSQTKEYDFFSLLFAIPSNLKRDDQADLISPGGLFNELTLRLILRVLKLHGEEFDGHQLIEILQSIEVTHRYEKQSEIWDWIEARPLVFQELLFACLEYGDTSDPARLFFDLSGWRPSPMWFPRWAIDLIDLSLDLKIKQGLFDLLKRFLHRHIKTDDFSFNELFACVERHPELNISCNEFFCPNEDWRFEDARRKKKYRDERRQKISKLQIDGHQDLELLRSGNARSEYMAQLAQKYLEAARKKPAGEGFDELLDFYGGDQTLAESAQCGLMNVFQRTDIPSSDEIIECSLDNSSFNLTHPCFVAAIEMYKRNDQELLTLDLEIQKSLVAFFLIGFHLEDIRWAKFYAQESSIIFAEVFLSFAVKNYAKTGEIRGISRLQSDVAFLKVAELVAPRLLEQIVDLRYKHQCDTFISVWRVAIKISPAKSLSTMLENKLAKNQLNRFARSTYLALAMCLSHDRYHSQLSDFLTSDPRKRIFAQIMLRIKVNQFMNIFNCETLTRLIVAFTSVYKFKEFRAGVVTFDKEASDLIGNFIHQLSNQATLAARDSLSYLAKEIVDPNWLFKIEDAIHVQRVKFREAMFVFPTPSQVATTLKNLQPANMPDLQALVYDILSGLKIEVRHGSSDAYKRFWSEDSFGRVSNPKIENSCRDALLDMLRARLWFLQIDVLPETQHANQKRADIAVRYPTLALSLPIEIKRSHHDDLWSAISNQLIPKYSLDPDSDGYGVFIVFWFGAGYLKKPSDKDKAPETAEQLENMLFDAMGIAERKKIKVCVFDVSKPKG